ncbi:MAG: methionyl-tRNA formyltransferase [Elusimicrobiota bacterium]
MKLAIIGRTEMLYETAIKLSKNHEIKLIVTAPSRPEYKKHPEGFKKLAMQIGAKYIFTKNVNDRKIIDYIKKEKLDLGVSINWVNIVKQECMGAFKLGILNAHCGDLPRYRGNACPNWAILNGEDKVVMSIHYMEAGKLDSGDILGQKSIEIKKNTYIGDIYKWLRQETPKLYVETVGKLQNNPGYIYKKQKEGPQPPLRCYPRIPEDSFIEWKKNAVYIHRLVRASSEPFSGAFTYYKSEKMTIWKARLEENNHEDSEYCGVPGQIAAINKDGTVSILTGRGKITIEQVSFKNPEKEIPSKFIKSMRDRLGLNLIKEYERFKNKNKN